MILGALSAAGAQAERIYGISTLDGISGSSLVTFDSSAPGSAVAIGPLTGMTPGQAVRAIDFRPSNGLLYALSTTADADTANPPSTNPAGQIYTVNLGTGVLTPVGSGFTLANASSRRISIDFNPVVDALRVVSGLNPTGTAGGGNYRVNPNTGALLQTDTSLFDPNDPANPVPFLGDIAYGNNVVGATSTTLYAYQTLLQFMNMPDRLVTVGGLGGTPSPNAGVVTRIADTNVSAFQSDVGFDISSSGAAFVSLDDFASSTDDDEFYTIDLASGQMTQLGTTFGFNLLDISVGLSPVPEPTTLAALGLGALALVRRRRSVKP